MDKFSKDLSRKIREFLEGILFLMVHIMKVNLETICLMEMGNFTGQMVLNMLGSGKIGRAHV